MQKTFGTLFSGGGVADCGFQAAGMQGLWAVEFDQAISDVYRQNFPNHDCRTSKVEDVDPISLPWVNHIHASPVCKEFSKAKTGGTEGVSDLSSALATCMILKHIQPDTFSLENVWAYRNSQSFDMITRYLYDMGYYTHYTHENSANYGVPQTRKRLILRASKNLLPELPTPVRWVGWYEAIEDLIPGLPESKFAPWQIARMPEDLKTCLVTNQGDKPIGHPERGPRRFQVNEPAGVVVSESCSRTRAFLAVCNGEGTTFMKDQSDPAGTIVANHGPGEYRAFIADGQANDNGEKITLRADDAPMFTIGASSAKRPARAFLMRAADNNAPICEQERPCCTLTATDGTHPVRAYLVNTTDTIRENTAIPDTDPSFTIRSNVTRRPITTPQAWLSQGRVVKMTPRALARFQSIPDWYKLPDNNKLAGTIIGNGFPSLMAQRIAEGFYPK